MAKIDWKDVDATVSNVMDVGPGGRGGHIYAVTFSYQVDDQYYSGEFSAYSSDAYAVGDTIALKYNPAKPGENSLDGKGKSFLWINWAISIFGSAVLVYLVCIRGCRTH